MLNEDYLKLTLFNEDLFDIIHNHVVDNIFSVSFFSLSARSTQIIRSYSNEIVLSVHVMNYFNDSFSLARLIHVHQMKSNSGEKNIPQEMKS